MESHDAYPWSELVPGAYVWDANGEPWKLIEEHPTQRHVFKATNVDGDVAVLRDPGKPVRAAVPDYEEALLHLHRILEARLMEQRVAFSPLPTTTTASSKAKIKAHLRNMHNEYVEPSMKVQDMLKCHEAAHAEGKFVIPHTHDRTQP